MTVTIFSEVGFSSLHTLEKRTELTGNILAVGENVLTFWVNFYRSITLIAEESEDMWHAYNLIMEGNIVRASTIRKVQTESATGSSTSNRVRTVLTIQVENIDFDTQACVLRLKGRNVEENQYVKVSVWFVLLLLLLSWNNFLDVWSCNFRWEPITRWTWR